MRSLLTLLALVTSFNVVSANQPENKNEFAEISTRNLSTEDLQLLNSQRAQAIEEELAQMDDDIDIESKASLLHKTGCFFISNDYLGAYHYATFFSPDGRVVELEDETQWFVAIKDIVKVSQWLTNDAIAIYPNKDLFWKTTNYKLTNISSGDTACVDLLRGPHLSSIYTKFVSAVDYFSDVVYLNDGSCWNISWSDSSILRQWFPNDVVVIGSNCGWGSSGYPTILINVTLNQYITASRAY